MERYCSYSTGLMPELLATSQMRHLSKTFVFENSRVDGLSDDSMRKASDYGRREPFLPPSISILLLLSSKLREFGFIAGADDIFLHD